MTRRSARQAAQARSPDRVDGQWTLPAHWPRFSTPEYYAWMMARMPAGAIPADWSRHQPHNSYGPLFWYEDKQQRCVACGVGFVFSKDEQQAWYEDYRIPIYAGASRCAACRQARRAARQAQKKHMQDMASREPHPHDAFFKHQRRKV